MNRSDDLNSLDPTDLKILLELIRDPRIQIGELSDKLRHRAEHRPVARTPMLRSGVLHDGGREIDLEAVGYDVVAFVTIEVTHRELDGVIAALRLIPRSSRCMRSPAGATSGAGWWRRTRTISRPRCVRSFGSKA